MLEIKIDADNPGKAPVRNIGFPLTFLTGTIDFDSSYPTGGEDFDVSDYFSKPVINVLVFPKGGYTFEYDKDNKKVKVFDAGTEVIDATDLSSLTGVQYLAIGWA